MRRSLEGPNRSVSLSRHRWADLSSPVCKHERNNFSKSDHVSGVSYDVREKGRSVLITEDGFRRSTGACCDRRRALNGVELSEKPDMMFQNVKSVG